MVEQDRALRSARIRITALVIGAALTVVVAAGFWIGIRALMVKSELEAITALPSTFRSAVDDRDVRALRSAATDLQTHAARAASLTGDPVWRIAELIPWVGPNLSAVRVVSDQLDSLSSQVVAPLVGLANDLGSAGGPADGGIDVSVIAQAQHPLQRASVVLDVASSALARLDTSALVPQLADGVGQLRDALGSADGTLDTVARASSALPGLLGLDAPRTLLLMVQNNAELRTGGGISGTFVQVHAEGGRLSLEGEADSSEFAHLPSPIIPLPDSLTALYGDVVGRFVQDTSMPADFSVSGRLAAQWWQSRTGSAPDAVISIDPIVLRSIVAVTGPIGLPDGSVLTADDLVQRLLVDPYLSLDSDQQTAYFTMATDAVFARLFTVGLDPMSWVQALAEPIRDGRISAWSADAATQRILLTTPLGGPAARQTLAGDHAYAVYFNDATGGKLDSFMKVGITSAVAQCRADDRREVIVSVRLTNGAPVDAGVRFPISMTGGGAYGVPAGDIGMVVAVSAPKDDFFGGVRSGGELVESTNGDDAGFAVSRARVDLHPGETKTLEFRFVTDEQNGFSPVILHTPLLAAPDISTAEAPCD